MDMKHQTKLAVQLSLLITEVEYEIAASAAIAAMLRDALVERGFDEELASNVSVAFAPSLFMAMMSESSEED